MHEVQKKQKLFDYAHLEKNHSKSRNLSCMSIYLCFLEDTVSMYSIILYYIIFLYPCKCHVMFLEYGYTHYIRIFPVYG